MHFPSEYRFLFHYFSAGYVDKLKALQDWMKIPESRKNEALSQLKTQYTIIPTENGIYVPELAE